MTNMEQEEYQEASRLTQGQADFAVRCMSEWISLSGNCPTSADVDHSSLLRRLLSGKEALDNAPPKRFAYPDYELGEGKPVKVMDVGDIEFGERKRVCIDQYSGWCWHDKENGLLMHLPDSSIYRLDGNILQKVTSDASA